MRSTYQPQGIAVPPHFAHELGQTPQVQLNSLYNVISNDIARGVPDLQITMSVSSAGWSPQFAAWAVSQVRYYGPNCWFVPPYIPPSTNYLRPSMPQAGVVNQALRTAGSQKVAAALVLQVCVRFIVHIAHSRFISLLFLPVAIGAVALLWYGLADVAESVGHSRSNGWWVLLGLIGIVIVYLKKPGTTAIF